MIFGIILYNFDPYNVFLAIATNMPVLLMTGFVVQGHKYTISTLVLVYLLHKVFLENTTLIKFKN